MGNEQPSGTATTPKSKKKNKERLLILIRQIRSLV
jgi:hypothetical protein